MPASEQIPPADPSDDAAMREAVDFATLVEQIPAVIYLDPLSEDEKSIYVSSQLERVLGYPTSMWIDDDEFWFNHVHPNDQDRMWDAYELSSTTGTPLHEEYRMISAAGRAIWVEERASVVAGSDGIPRFMQGVLIEVSKRKEAEAMKDTVLHAVSHDLKSPLAAIIGTVSTLLLPELSLSEQERTDFLRGILRGAMRMDRLVSDLLDLERINAGQLAAQRELTDLEPFLRSLVDELEVAPGRVQLEADDVAALVDRVMLARIVENLLRNALRFTPDGGSVRLSGRATADGVLLGVDDDGPGVPEAQREHIFDRFVRGNNLHGGAGIGLALVQEFAELHGGRAWVEASDTGGAAFRVFLQSSAAA